MGFVSSPLAKLKSKTVDWLIWVRCNLTFGQISTVDTNPSLTIVPPSNSFPSTWQVARTTILRKPHKPDYANPTAYRPIALLSCLGKVVEAVIAQRLKLQAKSRDVLPAGHYGGRQQRSTEDALAHLISWTHEPVVQGKFCGGTFLWFKSSFPHGWSSEAHWHSSATGLLPDDYWP